MPVPAPTAARRRPGLVRYGIPVLAIAAVIAAALALHVPRKIAVFFGFAEPAGARRITVFVPTVIGGSPQDQVLAAGLAEYLRLRLDEIARRSRSWVTPVDHLVSYDVREASDALRILGSNVVLSGTLKRAGDSINLTLDVINPASYRRVDSVAKSDQISNIATWQVDLVMEAAAALGLAAAELADRTFLAASGTTVPGAFESYIYGLGFMTSVYSGSGLGSAESADVLASAIGAFEEAVRLDPSFTSARIDLADALRRKSAPGEDQSPALQAEAMVRAIIKTDNSLAPAHLVLGSILRGLGRNEEAAGEIESSVDLDPLSYDALIKLGNLYEDMNQPAKAEAAYRAALHARPGYWAGATYLGVFFLYQGAYDKARDEYERAARACPGNFNILNNLGAAHFKLGEFAKAIAAFERSNAVKRNPDACSNLAVLYYYSGRYADSVTMNEAAIGFGLSDYAYLIWGNLADAYRYTPGNEAKAAEAYAKAIELTGQALAADPGDARTRASLAVFLAKAGEPERARIEIESALRAKPDDSSIVLKAVIVHELTGARPRALEAVREYVRLKGPMEEIVSDPFLAGLRQDPGYADITRK